MKRGISLLAYALARASMAENPVFSHTVPIPKYVTAAEWKRKKCKSCRKLGERCLPYTYRGSVLYKYSKPTSKACHKYEKK